VADLLQLTCSVQPTRDLYGRGWLNILYDGSVEQLRMRLYKAIVKLGSAD